MLGEAAKTFEDAERYAHAYRSALDRIAKEAKGGFTQVAGISVKLTALHPRYEFTHQAEAVAAVLPVVRELAIKASKADVHFTIDAEEADRLELQLDVFEALLADDELFANGWGGFGIAIQAYQKRAAPLVRLGRRGRARAWPQADGPAGQGRLLGHRGQGGAGRGPARLSGVHAQGRDRRLLSRLREDAARRRRRHLPRLRDPQCQHHRPGQGAGEGRPFEFQRLHGMGEALYDELARLEEAIGDARTPVRIYAPVGSHKDLLAYLVRRLLENGANSSFVNRIADEQVSLDELVRDPVAELEALKPKRNPKIVLPRELFGAERRNSAGVDLSDPLVREPLLERLKALESRSWTAKPTLGKGQGQGGRLRPTTAASTSARCSRRAPPKSTGWSAPAMPRRSVGTRLAAKRARSCSTAPPTSTRSMREEFFSLCIREAGKTLIDAVLEVREAVDFLRFYAAEARRQFTRPLPLPGPTGEQNELRLHGRGVFASISPWNFPLAIFTGLTSAPLAAGNAVIAKPAGQTPLIGALAVELMHQAGIPKDVVQLAPGAGQGRRRNADRASAARRRRFHRLDRDRAHDQPHAGRARRADHPVHRRNRRPECDDRRQFRAARAGHARRHFLGIPERRPALLGAAGAVRPGGRRRSDDRDDRRGDGGAEGRRSERACDRRRPGDRRGRQEAARRAHQMARQERQEALPAEGANGGRARLLRCSCSL